MSRIYLGRMKDGAGNWLNGEAVYLTKHQWDCGWYWGFGYLGNSRCHAHFDTTFLRGVLLASEIFESTNISDADWWVIRDLFVQAYALRQAAEVYRYGGHQTTQKGLTDLIQDRDMATRLNKDLSKVLDAVWDFTVKATRTKVTA